MQSSQDMANRELKELLKRVRKIEIKARGLSNQLFSGQYHAAFKGLGMSFSEVRAYQFGDDVRFIDWNVTARLNEPHVKVFEEERELSVVFLLDLSSSMRFGASDDQFRERMAEILCVLSFAAVQNNDKVGAIFFSGDQRSFIPPAKGKGHAMRIVRDVLAAPLPEGEATNLSEGLAFLNRALRKKATVFVLSDFLDTGFELALRLANQKHDIIALQLEDLSLSQLPKVGLLKIKDPETGKTQWLNTKSKRTQREWGRHYASHQKDLIRSCKAAGVDLAMLPGHLDYIKPLKQLFRKREMMR